MYFMNVLCLNYFFGVQGMILEISIMQFIASEVLSRVFAREQSPFIFIASIICVILCIKHLTQLARAPMTLDGRVHANQGLIALSCIFVFGHASNQITLYKCCVRAYVFEALPPA